mmetsp:Transcript_17980/g.41689  ORF Transcript_17980/g.41689 Transcript_17980/m.41689 type:complete len:153 (-) Transcript_17980:8-466(-)
MQVLVGTNRVDKVVEERMVGGGKELDNQGNKAKEKVAIQAKGRAKKKKRERTRRREEEREAEEVARNPSQQQPQQQQQKHQKHLKQQKWQHQPQQRQLVLLEEQHDYLAVSCCRCCPYEECFDCFKGSELHPNFIKTTAEGEDTVGASVLLA